MYQIFWSSFIFSDKFCIFALFYFALFFISSYILPSNFALALALWFALVFRAKQRARARAKFEGKIYGEMKKRAKKRAKPETTRMPNRVANNLAELRKFLILEKLPGKKFLAPKKWDKNILMETKSRRTDKIMLEV